MHWHWLDSCDSTSNQVQSKLRQGDAPPFAVISSEQSAGRGRRGRSWSSPEGNLYVSFALPKLDDDPRVQGLAPLKAAAVICAVVQQKFGIGLTIKWPNDLLFAGKKLGGVLVETSSDGHASGILCVGLGLNIKLAPERMGDDPTVPWPGTLEAALGCELDAEATISTLAHGFYEAWVALPPSGILDLWRQYATAPGQTWRKIGETQAWLQGEPQPTGELELLDPSGQKPPMRLSSIDHQLHWAYAYGARDSEVMAVADCGNTRTKLAIFTPASAPEPAFRVELAHQDASALAQALTRATSVPVAQAPVWYLGSVNPEASQRLAQAARSVGQNVSPIPKRRYRTHGSYATEALGADRLAAIEGTMALWRQRPSTMPWQEAEQLVVISLGTATTLDALTKSGEHLGGYILPGPALALRSLEGATGLLPQLAVSLLRHPGGLGSDTESAMVFGVRAMIMGAAAELARAAGFVPQVPWLLTGGDAEVFADGLPKQRQNLTSVYPDLVLHGLRIMALGG